MEHTTKVILEEIYQKLGIKKTVEENLCESLNHRELFYIHLEICIRMKKIMPYEYIRSIELLDKWIKMQRPVQK